jgi:Arc/MetJ family transcription regulator
MRTNIDINEDLLGKVLQLSKAKTKKEAIDQALQNYLRVLSQKELLKLKGKVKWEGDLDEMRSM